MNGVDETVVSRPAELAAGAAEGRRAGVAHGTQYRRDVNSRPAPRDLRASDTDRDRVVALLGEAAADGRLTLAEHSERVERACAARTLGELAALTSDLAVPDAQPIRLDGRRGVTGLFSPQRRDGRWVVPEVLPVTAIGTGVVLDLREALLHSSRVTIYATVIGGRLELIVPDAALVEITGTMIMSRKKVTGGPPPTADPPVIEVRTFAVAGTVKVVAPRRSIWRGLRRRGPAPRPGSGATRT
jgi:hypothetical protein